MPLLALLVWLVAAGAAAQAPEAERAPAAEPGDAAGARELARDFLRLGLSAVAEDRWDDALVAFGRAYALAPTPRVAFNLARAEEHAQHFVRALDLYRRFLREPDAPQEFLEDARRAVADLEQRVGTVRVSADGLLEDDALLLDGARLPHAVVGASMPVDPGPHALTVERDGAEIARCELVVEALVDGTAVLEVPPPPIEVSLTSDTASEDLAESPWLWTGIGVGVLAIAGGIVGLVLGLSSTEPVFGSGQSEVPVAVISFRP